MEKELIFTVKLRNPKKKGGEASIEVHALDEFNEPLGQLTARWCLDQGEPAMRASVMKTFEQLIFPK